MESKYTISRNCLEITLTKIRSSLLSLSFSSFKRVEFRRVGLALILGPCAYKLVNDLDEAMLNELEKFIPK
jgi:hypothetical protein